MNLVERRIHATFQLPFTEITDLLLGQRAGAGDGGGEAVEHAVDAPGGAEALFPGAPEPLKKTIDRVYRYFK